MSNPAFAQGERAATVLRENVPYSAQHLRFLAGLGFIQLELEAEPRDEVHCVVTCGGSTLRFCAGEKTTAKDHFNHIHMSIPTNLERFAAGPPPGGKRVRKWDPVYGPEGDDAVPEPTGMSGH